MWYKKGLTTCTKLALIIIGIIILAYYFPSFSEKFQSQHLSLNLKGNSKSSTNVECEEWAKTLIPKGVTLFYHGDNIVGDRWVVDKFKWADGNGIRKWDLSDIYWRLGDSTGQNVNYYYPKNDFQTGESLGYSLEVIDTDGTILDTNSFSVELVLKPIEGTDGKLHERPPTYDTKEFEIVGVVFLSCQLIKKINSELDHYINTPKLKEIDAAKNELSQAQAKNRDSLTLREKFILIDYEMSTPKIISIIGKPDEIKYPKVTSTKDGVASEMIIKQWFYYYDNNKLWIQMDFKEQDISSIVLVENDEIIKK